MKRLAHAQELLDGPLDDAATLRGNLRDLRRINRLLGGTRLSREAVFALLDGGTGARVLDVGTGAADIPVDLIRASNGRRLSVVATDSRPEVLAAARTLEPALDRTPGLEIRLGDGRSLDWPDHAFDVAHASMVLHHLEPPEAVAFLRELKRVAARGVVVNELARADPWVAIATYATPLVTRNRYTRNDAPLSVRRTYTIREMVQLLEAAGLRPIRRWDAILGHRYAFAAVAA